MDKKKLNNGEKNWLDTHADSVSLIQDSVTRCLAFSAKYLLQDDSTEEDDDKHDAVENSNSVYMRLRKQFIEDIKIALKGDDYVQQSYINYLDSLPTIEKKYEFLVDVYQHYFDYFVRDNFDLIMKERSKHEQ